MEQTTEQVYYMIRTKDQSKYLIARQSKYGTSINLSEDKSNIIEAHTLDTARKYVQRFIKEKKKINYSDLEIVKAKKVITIIDYDTYDTLPTTVHMCSSGFGYSLSNQEDYEKYNNCLGPTLETAKTKLTKEKITEWLYILYQNKNHKPLVDSFDYELQPHETYSKCYVNILIKNIIWK